MEMALRYEDYLAKHPVSPEVRAEIDAHKERVHAEVRAYRLRELRVQAGLTQAQLAERIGVGQRQVSKIESGDLDSARIGTVRRYFEAVGGDLAVEYVAGDERVQVA
jgi:DNA-binding XRE family transcriptional regulator